MGADSIGGQLCRDKECPFGGVTNSGTDSVSGQLNGDNECPFSGVTNLGADSIGGQLHSDNECPFNGKPVQALTVSVDSCMEITNDPLVA